MIKKLSTGLPLLLVVACATSPTGRKQLNLVSDEQLNQMGSEAFSQMKQATPASKEPAETAFVRCVAKSITAVVSDGPKQWEVVVFQDPTPNAFALPGGKIGVHTGMLQVARTPGQLAAVVGHEVAHVLARHGNERISQSLATETGLSLIAALTSGASAEDSRKRQLLLGLLGLGAQVGVLLPYSRAQEREADVMGIDLMAKAGFNPEESVTLWRNMDEAAGGRGPPEFLSTHPSHGTRIEDLQARMPQAKSFFEQARASGRGPSCPPVAGLDSRQGLAAE